ncbi:putative bifunctional diguanylate cyclase/phosphodiesterase [Roseibium sp.]|uniref:putative bifunctional diguanylate cyclase/phosphodiesterase n=1 Tax=Roseibium sp. TaxID=1936156 RepID=UPI003A970F6A
MLNRLRVKTKIHLPIVIVAMFALAVGSYSLYALNSNLVLGHVSKVQALVESAVSIAAENHKLAETGVLTQAEAQTRARNAIRAMVFDDGSRVFAFDRDGVRVVSNKLYDEGTKATSRQTVSMIDHALAGGGITYYNGARVLRGVETHSVPKAAWSQFFEPWGWVIASAVYLDDVNRAFWFNLVELVAFLGVCGVIVMVLANAIIRNLTEPLSDLTASMRELATGNTRIRISGTGRGDEIGEMAGAMVTFLDHEKQRHALQAQLRDLAYTDSLTGLANRVKFYDLLSESIDQAVQSGNKCALMILDLDRFKAVNDNLGHLAGDRILVEFSRRLEKVIGDRGSIGRQSGDEFFVILNDISDVSEAAEVARAILVESLVPIDLDGRPTPIAASIGIAFGPDDSETQSTLYRFADMALYEAKLAGGGCIRHYSQEMSEKAEKRFEMEALIKEGLLADEFIAHFQAKVDLKTGRVAGAEALCRWHSSKGTIGPVDFIPVAEETGLIVEIGSRMLLQACTLAAKCNNRSVTPFVVAVNVSPKQLHDTRFLATLDRCLSASNCHPSWIELEITESLLLSDLTETVQLLEMIAGRGVLITIDDFGTGYSAMSYLSRFPIKCLKIDQSFVRDMIPDRQKEILVTAILAMARGLGLKTVAEGVETDDVARRLSALNCDYGQGYFWHRPAPAQEFMEKLKSDMAA